VEAELAQLRNEHERRVALRSRVEREFQDTDAVVQKAQQKNQQLKQDVCVAQDWGPIPIHSFVPPPSRRAR
jgi:hypothetical protein